MQNRAKKTCKLFHVSCKKKTSCSTCCKKTSCSTYHAKNKLFHMSCKNHGKNKLFHMLQKPCKKQAVPHVAKNHAKTMQNAARTERQPAEPSLSPGSLLYALYVLYLTRQATEHPLSPGSLLYVLYALYLTRQATEHPLSPGSLLYVLYVLYLTRQPLNIHSPGFLAICAICAIWPYIAHILQIFARTEYIAHIVHIARSWERVGYGTYSTFSKDRGEWVFSGLARAAHPECQAWRGFNAGRWRGRGGFYAGQVGNFVACAATRVNHGILNQIVGEFNAGIPAFPVSLSVEGVFQMVCVLPESVQLDLVLSLDRFVSGFAGISCLGVWPNQSPKNTGCAPQCKMNLRTNSLRVGAGHGV